MTVKVLRAVTDLYVKCSLPLRADAIAASDNCNAPATTAVEMANGNRMYRCEEHRGVRALAQYGPVHTSIIVREEA